MISGTIHVDRPLSNFSLKYPNSGLISDMVCKRVKVNKESDKYYLYGRREFSIYDDERANGAETNFVDALSIESTPTYTCVEHALADIVTDRDRKNADKPLAPDFDITQNLTASLALARERRTAVLYTTAANYATSGHTVTLSGTQQFNNASFDSDSKTDAIRVRIDTGKEAIRTGCGNDPNQIIIPPAVSKIMARDSEIKDLVKYTDKTLLVDGKLPPTLWGMKVVVPGARYNSANIGQTFTGADVWGKDVHMSYNAANPMSPRTMTFAMTFMSQNRMASKWREEGRKADAIEISEILVEKIVGEYCGYLIKSAIA